MPSTQAQLIAAAYAEATLDSATAAMEDAAAIGAVVPGVVADLVARRIIPPINIEAIADSIFPDLVIVVGERAKRLFGTKAVPVDPAGIAGAEARLRGGFRLDRTLGTTPLVQAVLDRLEALGAGTNAVDATVVAGQVQTVLDDLTTRRVVTIANPGAVSSGQFQHVVNLVAWRVLPKAIDPAVVADSEAKLREAARLDRAAGTPLVRAVLERLEAIGAATDAIDALAVTGQVQATLDDLKARRIVTIANETAIGSAQFSHIVTLMAARLRPNAVDPAFVASAEAQLIKASRLDRAQVSKLVRTVLEQLETWGAGSSAIDASAVSDRIASTFASLAVRNVIYIADEASIPDAAQPDLARYIAASLAPVPMPDVIRDAERNLRMVASSDVKSRTVQTYYF